MAPAGHGEGGVAETKPVRDARSDLLSAIRIGEPLRATQLEIGQLVFLAVQLAVCPSHTCHRLHRHPAKESPRAAGAAEQAGASGERRGHHPVPTYRSGVQRL